jgi:hypothetical protein
MQSRGIEAITLALALATTPLSSLEVESPMQRSNVESLLACAGLLIGCVHRTTAPDGSAEKHAAQDAKREVVRTFETPCPTEAGHTGARVGSTGALPRPERVFLDTAVFELPTHVAQARSADLGSTLVVDPAVRLLGTPHLIVEGERSTMVLEDRIGLVTTSTLNELSASATFSDDQRTVLDLEIVLQVPPARGALSGELTARKQRIRMLLAPRDRQYVRSSAPIPEQPERTLLVLLTPYVLHDEQSVLRAIFECKMRRHQRSLERKRSPH